MATKKSGTSANKRTAKTKAYKVPQDAVERRYKYSEKMGATPSGYPKKTTSLYDKVSGVTKTTEKFPHNKPGFQARTSYGTSDAKTAAAAKRAGRNSTYMQNLSAGGRSKKSNVTKSAMKKATKSVKKI